MELNRKKIKDIVTVINIYVSQFQNSGIVGMGRILDLLVKEKAFNLNKFKLFIDNNLISATDKIYGKKLSVIDEISESNIDFILLLTKSATNLLESKLLKMKPGLKILTMQDLLTMNLNEDLIITK